MPPVGLVGARSKKGCQSTVVCIGRLVAAQKSVQRTSDFTVHGKW